MHAVPTLRVVGQGQFRESPHASSGLPVGYPRGDHCLSIFIRIYIRRYILCGLGTVGGSAVPARCPVCIMCTLAHTSTHYTTISLRTHPGSTIQLAGHPNQFLLALTVVKCFWNRRIKSGDKFTIFRKRAGRTNVDRTLYLVTEAVAAEAEETSNDGTTAPGVPNLPPS